MAGFLLLAAAVRSAGTPGFDEWLLRALRDPLDPAQPLGPRWLEVVARDLTALGGYAVLGAATLVVAGFLGLQRRFVLVSVVLVASIGGGLLSDLLKDLIARERPTVVPHLVAVLSPSFPSGHAMASAAVYVTLGVLLARTSDRVAVKVYFVASALTITLVVGATRVYLGVHYPTDVIAGWLAGLAWAVLCRSAVIALQRRGTVEPPT